MVSYDPRSQGGQAISLLHKGQSEKEREVPFHSEPGFNLQWLVHRIEAFHSQCMPGKAHAGKLPAHLLWRIDFRSCLRHNADTENGQDIYRSKVHLGKRRQRQRACQQHPIKAPPVLWNAWTVFTPRALINMNNDLKILCLNKPQGTITIKLRMELLQMNCI